MADSTRLNSIVSTEERCRVDTLMAYDSTTQWHGRRGNVVHLAWHYHPHHLHQNRSHPAEIGINVGKQKEQVPNHWARRLAGSKKYIYKHSVEGPPAPAFQIRCPWTLKRDHKLNQREFTQSAQYFPTLLILPMKGMAKTDNDCQNLLRQNETAQSEA